MTRQNLHTHTRYADGKNTVFEMAEAALAAGLDSLGFSEHGITPFDPKYSLARSEAPRYCAEVREAARRYAGRLEIFCGVEQDYYSEEPPFDTDYRIGSVHYIEKDGCYAVVDGGADILQSNADRYWNGSFDMMARDYFALVTALPEKTKCDIIGHLDLLTKYNESKALFDDGSPAYTEAAFAAIDSLCARDMIFEINTGAMARKLRTAPYPAMPLLRRIREKGGRILISSDCHYRDRLTYGFEAALSAAKTAGFNSVCRLTCGGFTEERI